MGVPSDVERSDQALKESHRALSLLRASCWLALFLVAAKAATWTERKFPGLAKRLLELVMSTWTDVLFALICGLIATLTVRTLVKWKRSALVVRVVFLGCFTVCAAYAVVAVGLFRYFNRPATFE